MIFPSKCSRKAILVCLDMLICIYGFLFCLPKQSLRYEVPSGKMHLRILTSIFYMIPIPTSLFPLTVTSLRLSADPSKWRKGFLQGSFFHSYGFSPVRAEAQASKHYSKTTRVTIQSPAHRASFGCHLCSPRRKPCHGALGRELCLHSAPSSRRMNTDTE